MDILTAVLEALQLRATYAQRVRVDDDHREHIERGHAVMIIVPDGRYTATTGRVQYDLAARDFLLAMSEQTVSLKRRSGTAQPLVRCDYTLRADLPHPLMRQLPPVLHFGARLLTDQAEFGRTIALLEAELANAPVGVDFVATRLAEIAFVEALRKGVLEKATEPAFLGALADPHVRASLDAVHRAPNEAWTVVDLAAIAKLSRAAFAERFQRLVGEPPLRYLRTWRLLNARRELARGKATVRIVAEHAGYRSTNGFSRAFRRFFRESPSAARRTS
ncbi:MAG TPA: helix-turn-helix domain-containing protein [Gammaproteobacteria bacterium]|nr:helix-turn-helix domain-containing protein [Gammaproteobacteria bacterium]